MNYIDADFPENLTLYFGGGAEFMTIVANSKSKREIRNQVWNCPRYKYSLMYKTCNNSAYQQLQTFFLICKGKGTAFNFLDRNDHTLENQQIGVGDGKTLQFKIYKTYVYKNYSFKRQIFKVTNVEVFVNSKLVPDDKYQINNGIISFSKSLIPEQNAIITINAKFYVIVRFDNDFFPVIQKSQSIELPDLSLIETQI